jgi:hypothetical protein
MALTKDKRSPSTLLLIEGRASPQPKICARSDRHREEIIILTTNTTGAPAAVTHLKKIARLTAAPRVV